MKKLLVAGIVLAAIFYALILFLTGSVGAISVTLAPGMNDVACPSGHRAQAAYTLDRSGLRVNCVLVATATGTPVVSPTATSTSTRVPTTPPQTPPATLSPTATSIPSTDPRCQNRPPLGGIEPQRPEWCFLPQSPAITTHLNGPNSWVDDWEHGSSHGRLGNVGDGYVAGHVGPGCESIHFRHNDHWMADVISHGQGQLCATWLRPERTFTGSVVIETEVAVPIAGTRGVSGLDDSWPEVVISTRSSPTSMNPWGSPFRRNGTYLYEAFPGAWTFGCRLQQAKHPICALYNNGTGFAGGPDRQWEINQNGGDVTDEFGGGPPAPGSARDVAWKACTSVDDPDVVCRNVFRLEITPSRIKIFVNGVRFYEAGLEDTQLSTILNGPFYVYFGEFAYRIHSGTILRSHWDHIAVNP